MKPITRYRPKDTELTAILESIYDAIEDLQEIPLLTFREVDLTFTGGSGLTQRVVHKLGRKYRGYFVTKDSAGVTLALDSTVTSKPEIDFYLTSSAPASVTLWVY